MADRAFPRTAFHAGVEVGQVFVGGEEAEFVFGKGTQVLPFLGVEIYGCLGFREITDATGQWWEVGFKMDHSLSGNAATGWTDSGNYFLLELQQSADLGTWNMGKFVPAPVPVVDLGGGVYEYWARCTIPRLWEFVTIDLTLTSGRHAKEITALQLRGSTISLPNYPYAMPADAAQLQTDLIAAGYTGSTVSTAAAPLSVEVKNYINDGIQTFAVTLSGSDVTQVKNAAGSTITLPGYPYAIPSQVSNLKADLIAAGFPYIGVRAYDDEWTIFIPNRDTILNQRQIVVVISPADAHTYQGIFGTGTDAGNSVSGTSGNVRATVGLAPLEEAPRQFSRLKITSGSRYNHLMP